MLLVQIYRNKKKEIIGYTAKGHCGYAESGKDIVCAGVSTLLQLPIIGLKNLSEEMSDKFNIVINKGDLEVKIPSEYPQINLEIILAGLMEIEKQYPEYVKIEVKNAIQSEEKNT